MAKQPVDVPNMPQAIGPFSYAIRSDGMVYVSGCVGVDENWKVVAPNDIVAQTRKTPTVCSLGPRRRRRPCFIPCLRPRTRRSPRSWSRSMIV